MTPTSSLTVRYVGGPTAAIAPSELGRIDAVLLSHDQHPDNLDRLGREYLAEAPLVLSTASAAARLPVAVTGLANWASTEAGGPASGALRVTGVPARHGPEGSEKLVGEVSGFRRLRGRAHGLHQRRQRFAGRGADDRRTGRPV